MQNLLLQTTIEADPDDWDIARFSRLGECLSQLHDHDGNLAFRVTARNRNPRGQPDAILSRLPDSGFDQLWLFAADAGDDLTAADCASIIRFREMDGRLLITRDHMDVGSSVCDLRCSRRKNNSASSWPTRKRAPPACRTPSSRWRF
ncbi:MAG: hypothetical protein ACREPS_07560 [Rhodanobacteraceae bacterium]